MKYIIYVKKRDSKQEKEPRSEGHAELVENSKQSDKIVKVLNLVDFIYQG